METSFDHDDDLRNSQKTIYWDSIDEVKNKDTNEIFIIEEH